MHENKNKTYIYFAIAGAVLLLIVLGASVMRATGHSDTISDSNTTASTTNATILKLREFGVQIDVPKAIQGATYTVTQKAGVGNALHVKDIAIENCELGTFYEIQKNAIASSHTKWTAKSLKNAEVANAMPAQVKEFTDFYLVFEPSQVACGAGEKKDAMASDRLALWNSLVSARFSE